MNKRFLVIASIVAGVLVIATPYVLIVRGIAYERQQQVGLGDQVEILEGALTGQQAGGAGLVSTREAEWTTAQAEWAAMQFAFPSEVDETEVLSYVFGAANSTGVRVIRMEARDPLTGTLGAGEYTVFAYDVEIEGELDAVTAFIATLESGSIETLIVDQVRLDAQPAPQPAYRARLAVQVFVRR